MREFKDRRVLIYMWTLMLFAAWLGSLLFWLFPHCVPYMKELDPLMALLGGLGIGSITQFFISLLTIGWYFFYRKGGPNQGEPTR